jgi:hypothetical protein
MIEVAQEVEHIINESLRIVNSKRKLVIYDDYYMPSNNCLIANVDVVGRQSGHRVLEIVYLDYWIIIRKIRFYNSKAIVEFLGRVNRAFDLNHQDSLTDIGNLIKSLYKDSYKTLKNKWTFSFI